MPVAMVHLRALLLRFLNPHRPPRQSWLYRGWQVAMALGHRPTPEELLQVRDFLPSRLWELFCGMPPAEQAHGLRVWYGLRRRGVEQPEVLMAGLLHDVARARTRLRLCDRILAVLLQAAPTGFTRWCGPRQRRRWWCRGWWVARQHPHWGAAMLQARGAPELTVRLVRHHHDDPAGFPDPTFRALLTLFQEVDQQA